MTAEPTVEIEVEGVTDFTVTITPNEPEALPPNPVAAESEEA